MKKRNFFTVLGLCMLACLLVVDRFVVTLPDWAAILVALVSCVLVFIGFRKSCENKRG